MSYKGNYFPIHTEFIQVSFCVNLMRQMESAIEQTDLSLLWTVVKVNNGA